MKLADKICNLTDVAGSPPVAWTIERRREYFDWAKSVIDRLRGVDAALEAAFDRTYATRPCAAWHLAGEQWHRRIATASWYGVSLRQARADSRRPRRLPCVPPFPEHRARRAAALALAAPAHAIDQLKVMIPAGPGGGFDQTGRNLGAAHAGGRVGQEHPVRQQGRRRRRHRPRAVRHHEQGRSQRAVRRRDGDGRRDPHEQEPGQSLANVVPIARLTAEPEALVVNATRRSRAPRTGRRAQGESGRGELRGRIRGRHRPHPRRADRARTRASIRARSTTWRSPAAPRR